MPPLGPRRLAATNTAPMAHVRGERKRARRCYLTKKTFLGTTTLQIRWEIVNLYAYEGVRGWAELSRRFSALHPRSPRNYQTCRRVVNDGAMLGIRMAAIGVKQEHFPKWWRHCGMVID